MNLGIVICARVDSTRIPNKVFRKINGKPLLNHLVERLIPAGLPIAIGYPELQDAEFIPLISDFPHLNYYARNEFDSKSPLHSLNTIARKLNIDAVVRVTADKIFVDHEDILKGVEVFKDKGLDYLYSSTITPGCGFEIISSDALEKAAHTFKDPVEFTSYAIRAVTDNIYDLDFSKKHLRKTRLLIDFPEDLKFIDALCACVGNNASVTEVLKFITENAWITQLNKQPEVTVYTCAYNAEKYIKECLDSVKSQEGFDSFEFILIDDYSTDGTPKHLVRFACQHKNVKYVRNPENLGLATSSNIALSLARGRHIVRLDADDYFVDRRAIAQMLYEIKDRSLDVVYPNNYFGSQSIIQKGSQDHHVGGALFRTHAVNHVKFTDGLRGYEGYDFFVRAKDQIKVGYLNRPLFFYRQHADSLTKNNIEYRTKIKTEIDLKHGSSAS